MRLQVSAVPEPSSLVLMALGCGGMGFLALRRTKRRVSIMRWHGVVACVLILTAWIGSGLTKADDNAGKLGPPTWAALEAASTASRGCAARGVSRGGR